MQQVFVSFASAESRSVSSVRLECHRRSYVIAWLNLMMILMGDSCERERERVCENARYREELISLWGIRVLPPITEIQSE